MSKDAVPRTPSEPDGHGPGSRSRRRWWLAAAIVVVVAVVAAAVVAGIAIGRSAPAAALTLVPADKPGPNPFTDSAQTETAPAASATVTRKTEQLRATLPKAGGTSTPVAEGTAPGLYGGSGNAQVCDAQRLVRFLQDAPAKAAAWAHVLGIAPATIEHYVAGLTPVILNSDTLVQNHGYHAGAATSFPAILQAGTAVMVDSAGLPRVKCNCGNPLTEPSVVSVPSAPTTGAVWPGYTAGGVMLVHGGTASGSLQLVDRASGQVYAQPLGAAAAVWAAASLTSSAGAGIADQSVLWTSADGTAWTQRATVPHELIMGLAWGDGRWVAVAASDDQATIHSEILTSPDLSTWTVATTVTGRLRGVGFGRGGWLAVGDPSDGYSDSLGLSEPSGHADVYASTDGATWTKTTTVDTPGSDGFWSIAYGDGHWVATANAIYVQNSPVNVYQSSDGTAWTTSGAGIAQQTDGIVAYGADDGWRMAASTTYPADPASFDPPLQDTLINAGAGAGAWTTSSPAALKQQLPHALASGAGRWLLGSEDSELMNQGHAFNTTRVSASEDGISWTTAGRIDGPLGALAYGSVAAAASPGTTSTPTATPAPTTAPSAGGSGGTPDCTAAALQRALVAAGLPGTIGSDLACSAGWAAAGVNHPESQTTAVFQWVDGAWQWRDRTTVCSQNVLPPAVAPAACQSN
ncbi:DUF6777 domain-containing protein [Leifsonia shinshuensis]|uniref:DUF6777 domain-containing protein n=1 Tax=Leifsonia shinshuensis TaxID=150026 RepID=A0A7G6Y8R5_9MICO|nr:DUF6777 domain-containing protein [Leifsonia shinshuensis]QNE34880.1 hypothetical protein F1C12_06895 [Leifsonia shinshuensis]